MKVPFKMQKLTKAPVLGKYTWKEARMRIVSQMRLTGISCRKARRSSSTLSLILLMLMIYFERKFKKCVNRLERTREKSAHAQFGGRICIPRFYNVKKPTFTYKLPAPI